MKRTCKFTLKDELGEISEVELAEAIHKAKMQHKDVIELRDIKGQKIIINIHRTEDMHVIPQLCENRPRA